VESKIGEVIESTSTEFAAECYTLYDLPPLGSLVKTADQSVEIFGIVCQAGTASIESGRRPIARGKDELSDEAIYQSSPQLLKLLRSEFRVLVVGYEMDNKIYQYLPPRPARIHAFVHACTKDEIKKFSQSFDFLNLLLNISPQVPVDEMVAAALREMSILQDDPHAFLTAAGKQLTARLGGEYGRLKAILGRMRP
jgi:hypothetical protein